MENENRPHFKPGAVKYTKGYGRRLVMSKLIKVFLVLAVLLCVAGSTYVFLKQPVKTENGYIMTAIKHTSFSIGEEIVIVEDASYNLFTPLERALMTTKVYNAEVVAGPYGEIKSVNQVVSGTTVSEVNLESKDDGYLDDEYIVRVKELPYDFIVKRENIVGLNKEN